MCVPSSAAGTASTAAGGVTASTDGKAPSARWVTLTCSINEGLSQLLLSHISAHITYVVTCDIVTLFFTCHIINRYARRSAKWPTAPATASAGRASASAAGAGPAGTAKRVSTRSHMGMGRGALVGLSKWVSGIFGRNSKATKHYFHSIQQKVDKII